MHTFLLHPATWIITGTYSSAGKTVMVTGKSVIVHHDTIWNIDSLLTLENGGSLHIIYDALPTQNACISFTASSNALGKITGTFTLQDNKINEVYATENKQLTGQEIMTMVSKNQYTSQGTLSHQETVKSTWSLNYHTQE